MNLLIPIVFLTLLLTDPSEKAALQSTSDGEPKSAALSEDSRMIIEGTSTLHSWDVEAKEFSVDFKIPPKWFESTENWNGDDIVQLTVKVPVEEMDGGRSRMNRDLREAMRCEEYPEIEFIWSSLSFTDADSEDQKEVDVSGSLKIAGVTRDVEFTAVLKLTENGEIKASGSYEINMKDYEIEPPRAMLGTIRTGELIELRYDIVFGKP